MFAHFAGLSLEGQNLNQVLVTWWTAMAGHKLQQIMTYNRVVYQVTLNVWQFAMTIFPTLKQFPTNWSDMIKFSEDTSQRFTTKRSVGSPQMQITINIKCNTDGASKGNPGKRSYAYCL